MSFIVNPIKAQQIRKTGVSYVNLTYSNLKYGNAVSIGYANYFKKGLSYNVFISMEQSNIDLTSYNTYKLDLGLNKSFTIPVNGLYLNLLGLFYLGQEYIKNENYPYADNFIYGFGFCPSIEYFFLDNLSIALGATLHKDFNSKQRNNHYSFDITLSYILE